MMVLRWLMRESPAAAASSSQGTPNWGRRARMLRPVGRRLTCWRKQAGSCLELATRLLEVAVKTCRGPVNSGRAARQRSAGIGGSCIFGRGCGGLLSRAVRLQKHPEKGFPGCVLACCLRDAELEAIGSILSLSELGGVSLSGNKDAKMGWILPPQTYGGVAQHA